MIYLCRRMAKKGSWIERKFSIDYDIIILAQFISYMAGYFLSARMIRSYSYSSGFGQKLNMFLSLFLIIFALNITFMIVPIFQEEDKNVKVKPRSGLLYKIFISKFNKKSYWSSSQKEYSGLFYCGLCSSILPLVIILGDIYVIFVVGMLIFWKGFKNACRQEYFLCNRMILALYPLLFHFSFGLMIFSYRFGWMQGYYLLGIVSIMILLLGSLHEVVNLLLSWIYELVIILRWFYCKNQVSDMRRQNERKQISMMNEMKLKNNFG